WVADGARRARRQGTPGLGDRRALLPGQDCDGAVLRRADPAQSERTAVHSQNRRFHLLCVRRGAVLTSVSAELPLLLIRPAEPARYPLEQQRLSCRARQGISKAVAEIQPRRVTAAPAEVAIGFARDPRLDFGDRFDDQLRLVDEVIKTAAGDG